jgi:hypothetical protein
MFFPTSLIALILSFWTLSLTDFLADLQKSISVASNLLASYVFSIHVSALYSKTPWTTDWYTRVLVLWRIFLLQRTEFNMPLTLLPSVIPEQAPVYVDAWLCPRTVFTVQNPREQIPRLVHSGFSSVNTVTVETQLHLLLQYVPTGVGCLSKGHCTALSLNGRRSKHAWHTVWPQYKRRGTLSPWSPKTSSHTRHSSTCQQ